MLQTKDQYNISSWKLGVQYGSIPQDAESRQIRRVFGTQRTVWTVDGEEYAIGVVREQVAEV